MEELKVGTKLRVAASEFVHTKEGTIYTITDNIGLGYYSLDSGYCAGWDNDLLVIQATDRILAILEVVTE